MRHSVHMQRVLAITGALYSFMSDNLNMSGLKFPRDIERLILYGLEIPVIRKPNLRVCLIRYEPGQTANHDMNHDPMDHGLTRRGEVFIIFTQASVAIEPAQSPLDDPALRDDHKSLGAAGAFRNFQADWPLGSQRSDPVHQWPDIGSIGPDMPQSRKLMPQDGQEAFRAVAVLDAGSRHDHRED
jgi:hypothetical protein